MKKLDSRPARTDLTDRECSKLLGAMIGGLCNMADIETVRAAVRWIAETDEFWALVNAQTEQLKRAMNGGA